MSDDEREPSPVEKLNEAIRTYVRDAGRGDYLTGWYLIAAAVAPDDPDATAYVHAEPDQPIHVAKGLLDVALIRIEKIIREGDEVE